MDHFKLVSEYAPTGDQPRAIEELVKGFKEGNQFETLLGVTGSGKTFTMANVIQALNKPTLIISHNKTLAGQLYGEMKEFFPENAVEYLSLIHIYKAALSGTARYLADLIKAHLGCKTRAVELSVLQRCASPLASRTDVTEAYQVGGAAVEAAYRGETGKMCTIYRVSDIPYLSLIHIWIDRCGGCFIVFLELENNLILCV